MYQTTKNKSKTMSSGTYNREIDFLTFDFLFGIAFGFSFEGGVCGLVGMMSHLTDLKHLYVCACDRCGETYLTSKMSKTTHCRECRHTIDLREAALREAALLEAARKAALFQTRRCAYKNGRGQCTHPAQGGSLYCHNHW